MGGHSPRSCSVSFKRPLPPPPPDLLISCPGIPDVGTNFYIAGTYNGRSYYKNIPGTFYVWRHIAGLWIISANLGSSTGGYYWRFEQFVEKLYKPELPFVGYAYATLGAIPPVPLNLPLATWEATNGDYLIRLVFPQNMQNIEPQIPQITIKVNDVTIVGITSITYISATIFDLKFDTVITPITSVKILYTPSPIPFIASNERIYDIAFNITATPS